MLIMMFRQSGGKLAHMAGFLGLVEVWIFIVYVVGEAAHFTSAEHVSVKAPDVLNMLMFRRTLLTAVWRVQA